MVKNNIEVVFQQTFTIFASEAGTESSSVIMKMIIVHEVFAGTNYASYCRHLVVAHVEQILDDKDFTMATMLKQDLLSDTTICIKHLR